MNEYAMIFPFVGVLFLADWMSFTLKGDLIVEKLLSLDFLYISAFIIVALIASSATEAVNLFGNEWEYLKMPFLNFKVFTIPVAVFIGCVPPICEVVGIVNMTKNFNKKI